jgi:hypothetical protein
MRLSTLQRGLKRERTEPSGLSLPLRDYLGSVLPGLANVPINRVAELTPRAWAASI